MPESIFSSKYTQIDLPDMLEFVYNSEYRSYLGDSIIGSIVGTSSFKPISEKTKAERHGLEEDGITSLEIMGNQPYVYEQELPHRHPKKDGTKTMSILHTEYLRNYKHYAFDVYFIKDLSPNNKTHADKIVKYGKELYQHYTKKQININLFFSGIRHGWVVHAYIMETPTGIYSIIGVYYDGPPHDIQNNIKKYKPTPKCGVSRCADFLKARF